MATKKRFKVPATSPGDPKRPESEVDVETTRSMNVNEDVEHVDGNASPAIAGVENPDAGYRVDIESGGETDAGDVERGPA